MNERETMTPYRVRLDDWTVALFVTDGGLTLTVTNDDEPDDYTTRMVGDIRLRRYYLGRQCAGELKPLPYPIYRDGKPVSKEALLAAEGSG